VPGNAGKVGAFLVLGLIFVALVVIWCVVLATARQQPR
jgi:hypothetical protein